MENKRKICFRTDASAEIGYGHFIRTLALADMLKDDFECVFYTQSPTEYQRTEAEKVCKLVALPADDSRFQLFLDSLVGNEIVVLDNYFYTTDYQHAIREKGCKLVCIDDPHGIHYVCDVLISHGFSKPTDFDAEPYTEIYTGIEWALLRSPFLRKIDFEQKRNNSIVLNFGGADPFQVTERVVGLLLKLNLSYQIKVILGDRVFLSEKNRSQVQTLHNLSAEQMAELFNNSALGIFTASTVCIEGLSRRLPLIVGYDVDNQERSYLRMRSEGLISPLGWLQDVTSESLLEAIKGVKDLKSINIHPEQIKEKYRTLFLKQ